MPDSMARLDGQTQWPDSMARLNGQTRWLGTMLFNKLLLAIKAGDIEAVMQEIRRHLLFCVQYSIIYARNAYFCIKQGYFYPYTTQNAQ